MLPDSPYEIQKVIFDSKSNKSSFASEAVLGAQNSEVSTDEKLFIVANSQFVAK